VPACTHLDSIEITELPDTIDGCEDCLRAGGEWCHLRICLTCGHVGCCDSSPGRHASAHASSTDHPIMRSVQPGEDWSWCYVDELSMRIHEVQGEPRVPPSPLCP
jgi:uncharacterized UBP type Zn finger protein